MATLPRATVETNGKTVWVNAPNCIGRFGPMAWEVSSGVEKAMFASPIKFQAFNDPEKTVSDYWNEWTEAMKNTHGLVVDGKLRPITISYFDGK